MASPLNILLCASNSEVLVELKNGECYNGTLRITDPFMNLHLEDVTCT